MRRELMVSYGHGQAQEWAFRTPARLSPTLMNAELGGNARNTDPESLFEGGVDGAKVPYIPEYQINGEVGIEFGKVGTYTSMVVPPMFTSASNTSVNARADGVPDARAGELSSYFINDLSIRYQLPGFLDSSTRVLISISEMACLLFTFFSGGELGSWNRAPCSCLKIESLCSCDSALLWASATRKRARCVDWIKVDALPL
ncbi:MAG: hypothetical protein M2R45_01529 [Verrucomicrobia subdivision 3 bacterium]|nr:hypothetical protein [Limisphaerales bacterium]MCS1413343.1 hypothetical protein [Limisphaerales bacterium]